MASWEGFVWERPLRPADVEALGGAAPDGPVLGARVPDLGTEEALLADDPAVYFTTPRFDGYPAVLTAAARSALRSPFGETATVSRPSQVASPRSSAASSPATCSPGEPGSAKAPRTLRREPA